MNQVQAQRERALTDARNRRDEADALVHAWSQRLEMYEAAVNTERDPIAGQIAVEMVDYCRERGTVAKRRLMAAQGDVDRILASMAAATRVVPAS